MSHSMKTLALGLILAMGCASGALAEESRGPGLITVSGESRVMVTPDIVIISFGVETEDLDVEKARRENDEIVKRVFDTARKHGIEDKNISTDSLSLRPSYNYKKREENGARVVDSFVITKNVRIILHDASKYEALLMELINCGVKYAYNVQFQVADLNEYRERARDLALKAARDKAEKMTGALGQGVGKVYSITENANVSSYGGGYYERPRYFNVAVEVQPEGAQDLEVTALGQIPIKASVTISFEIE